MGIEFDGPGYTLAAVALGFVSGIGDDLLLVLLPSMRLWGVLR
jgi:hypothetical protein